MAAVEQTCLNEAGFFRRNGASCVHASMQQEGEDAGNIGTLCPIPEWRRV